MKTIPLRWSTLIISWSSSLFIHPQQVGSATVHYDFVLSTKLGDAYSPDCTNVKNLRRWLFLAETPSQPAAMPGPTIEANEGDVIHIKVTNHHPSMGVTLHYHGLHQLGTPWADGPVQVTQCTLAPLQSQEYEFLASPPGTHYWHAHNGLDVGDGLTGAIIVHPKEPEPFDYDEERMVFLQDFYLETGAQQEAGLENYPFTWIGNPVSLLINGKGLASQCQPGGASSGDTGVCLDTCNNTLAWLPTILVEAGKTYRLRIINSAQLVMQNVAIAGHDMTIVEVEGTLVEPVVVQNLDLSPGQRVSVLITADQTPDNYWLETVVRERNIPGLTGRAILTYSSETLTLPDDSSPPSHPAWNESSAAIALEDMLLTQNVSKHAEAPALDAEDVVRYILVGTQNERLDESGNVVQLRWAVNNVSYAHPSDPLIGLAVQESRRLGWPLDAALEGTIDMPQTPPMTWDYTLPVDSTGGPGRNLDRKATAVVRLQKGQVFEFVLQNARALNGVAEFHPWHIHGHSFWIVGRGEGTYDPETHVANYNLENPLLRDTVTLWPLGWVALRMVADNPGVWFFHCHLSSHQVMGMALAIIVEPDEIGLPSESVAFCGKESLDANSGVLGANGSETDTNGVSGEMIVVPSAAAVFLSFFWLF